MRFSDKAFQAEGGTDLMLTGSDALAIITTPEKEDKVDRINRIDRIALRGGHFAALGVRIASLEVLGNKRRQ
jgi:hypothetical protein